MRTDLNLRSDDLIQPSLGHTFRSDTTFALRQPSVWYYYLRLIQPSLWYCLRSDTTITLCWTAWTSSSNSTFALTLASSNSAFALIWYCLRYGTTFALILPSLWYSLSSLFYTAFALIQPYFPLIQSSLWCNLNPFIPTVPYSGHITGFVSLF